MHIFQSHINKFTHVGNEEFAEVLQYFQIQTYRKKENLLVEGQLCKYRYFVLKGCLRKFFIDDKGTEQTTEFAIENWWLTDTIAFEHQLQTQFYIQAMETSEVLFIERKALDELLDRHPVLERYFRFIYQRAFAAAQMRFKYLYGYSKEEMYHFFMVKHPEFAQRIPQKYLASFLGFTPEYLSELRKKSVT